MSQEDSVARLDEIRERAQVAAASASTLQELDEVRTGFLGRKSDLAQISASLRDLDEASRREVGKAATEVRSAIQSAIAARTADLEASEQEGRVQAEMIDVTLPGRMPQLGRLHPVTQVLDEIVDVFVGLGFNVVTGPEVETDWYNFQALNIPPDHPARSLWDSFYLEPNAHGQALFRTHTSPVQARVMESTEPPIYVIVPGRCARRDVPDPKRLSVFTQVEGLAVDDGISFADMKGTLEAFAKAMFGPHQRIRLVPDYFPFTEPSAEVAVLCFVCEGSGCFTCRGEGWLELLGAGMVHPNVFEAVGYDRDSTGFAFGMGIERIAMARYQVPDIRWFHENDLRFLEAF